MPRATIEESDTAEREESQRLPLLLPVKLKNAIGDAATRETKGNMSRWVINAANGYLSSSLPVVGAACCGTGLDAEVQEPLARLRYLRDVMPCSPGAPVYLLKAEGDSMNNFVDRPLDIQDGDLLPFVETPDADNGQTIHYEIAGEFGDRKCGIRIFYMRPGGEVTLRAANDGVLPGTATRLHPDIVLRRDDVIVKGYWLKVAIRGVRL